MENIYEYCFDNILDYSDFKYNCYLNYPEIVLKPIVNQYHSNPSQLTLQRSSTEITASGNIFGHDVVVVYTTDQITITFQHQFFRLNGPEYYVSEKWKYITMYDENEKIVGLYPWVYRRGKIPVRLPPKEGTSDATVIIRLRIPEITHYFWCLWQDSDDGDDSDVPPFDPIVDKFAIYIRAFYISLQVDSNHEPDPTIKQPDERRMFYCSDKIIRKIRHYAENEHGSKFDPFSAHCLLTSACLRWKAYLYIRHYNRCIAEISSLPGIGIHYQNAKDDWANLNS